MSGWWGDIVAIRSSRGVILYAHGNSSPQGNRRGQRMIPQDDMMTHEGGLYGRWMDVGEISLVYNADMKGYPMHQVPFTEDTIWNYS